MDHKMALRVTRVSLHRDLSLSAILYETLLPLLYS